MVSKKIRLIMQESLVASFRLLWDVDVHHPMNSLPAVRKRPGVIERLFAALLFGELAEAAAGDEGFDEAVGDVGGGEESEGLEG